MQRIEYVVPYNTEVIFVSDFFLEDYQGGAELTTEAMISSSPLLCFKLHSASVTPDMVTKNKEKIWIITNWSQMAELVILSLVKENVKYFVVEYDYKACIYRSRHLHKLQTGLDCTCSLDRRGKIVEGFYKRAQHVFFMSTGQHQEYVNMFPMMSRWSNTSVLSSLWSDQDLDYLLSLKKENRNGIWAVLSGGSWIKNQAETEVYCKTKMLQYELIGNLPYRSFLKKLSEYEGIVFHPKGFDTCPRLVVEAKLLGLSLDLNENVQHKDEEWFSGTVETCLNYLKSGKDRFWRKINGQ